MATLHITEYALTDYTRNGKDLSFPLEPAGVEQTPVSFTTAAQSAAFNAATRYVRLYASAACHVKFGADPTATANHQPLAATTEYFREVIPGQKVSVYDGTSS